jgi:hypothetical protein
MAVRGTKPKPDGQKRNRVKPVHDWTEVVDVPFKGAPPLPKARPDGRSWPKWTRDWWRSVSTMPHCRLWSDSDWRYAMETAAVVAEMHEGNMRLATEVRNREKILGTTMDFRRDLRIRYVAEEDAAEPATPAGGNVTQIDGYRDAV